MTTAYDTAAGALAPEEEAQLGTSGQGPDVRGTP